jgi:hypothetical protein
MSHVKRDGKCYDLNYTVNLSQSNEFEFFEYARTFSLLSSLAVVTSIFNRKIAAVMVVIATIIFILQWAFSNNRPTDINLSPDVAKEVKCPSEFEYNQQVLNRNACVNKCEELIKSKFYMNV